MQRPPHVVIAGDGTSHAHHHGGIATEVADTVAAGIPARAGALLAPVPFRPVMRALRATAAPHGERHAKAGTS